MDQKPCGRTGCRNVIEGPPYRLRLRTYCSTSCATLGRMANGWQAARYLTTAARRRGAKIGGKVSGQKRHLDALAKAVHACEVFLTADVTEGMTSAQITRFRVLLGRAYVKGHLRGRQATDTNRRYWQKQAEQQRQRTAA